MPKSEKLSKLIKKVLKGIGQMIIAQLLKQNEREFGFVLIIFHSEQRQVHMIHSGICEKSLAWSLSNIAKKTACEKPNLPPLQTMN